MHVESKLFVAWVAISCLSSVNSWCDCSFHKIHQSLQHDDMHTSVHFMMDTLVWSLRVFITDEKLTECPQCNGKGFFAVRRLLLCWKQLVNSFINVSCTTTMLRSTSCNGPHYCIILPSILVNIGCITQTSSGFVGAYALHWPLETLKERTMLYSSAAKIEVACNCQQSLVFYDLSVG